MLFGILFTIQIIICISMGGLILIQRSEGGALGMGGGPSGFMSARGAGNLLTRTTGILAIAFFVCSIGLTIVGNMDSKVGSATDKVDTSGFVLDRSKQPAQQQPAAASSASSAPSLTDLPLAGVTPTAQPAPSSAPVSGTPVPAASNSAPAVLPAPLKMPASSSGSSSSLSQQKVNQAKNNILQGMSSSSAAPASKAATPSSSTSSTPQ